MFSNTSVLGYSTNIRTFSVFIMDSPFNTIGLIGKPNHPNAAATLQRLHTFLLALGFEVIVEKRTGSQLSDVPSDKLVKLVDLGERADLAIVVGGDGNMLGAARVLARFDIAVIGVNRGNLGFLTDLNPEGFEGSLEQVLSGDYIEEKRFLLEVEVYRHNELKSANSAVNEAVLHADKVAHMIEFEAFINDAHKKVGASGNYFCIVLFGKATSFPHGVKDPQVLKKNDLVLIDTGCKVHGYLSDITRTYCFGEPTDKQRALWESEKRAQLAAFNAAKVGVPCGDVDKAARDSLAKDGLGPDYNLPGLPHRTGHGIGMDIHEWPYLVKDNPHPLAPGMCFSNEPMIVVPNEFGIRLEDHFYMTEDGPVWFTEPSESIDSL